MDCEDSDQPAYRVTNYCRTFYVTKIRISDREFSITKTCLYNVDTLKHHFHKVKLGFTVVYIFLLIPAKKKTDFRVFVKAAWQRRSYEYPTIDVLSRNMKISVFFFLPENFQFLEVKFSVYLNRRVFVMLSRKC